MAFEYESDTSDLYRSDEDDDDSVIIGMMSAESNDSGLPQEDNPRYVKFSLAESDDDQSPTLKIKLLSDEEIK